MKRLIVNADDFGYTRGVNAGIIHGFREGILTSTTVMANGAAFEDAIERAKANALLGVGCHLVLVGGKAVAGKQQIASLVDADGNLPPTLGALIAKLTYGSVKSDEIVCELRAQVEKVMSFGIQPTHFDSHKHTHSHPRVMEAVMKVAEEFKIKRIRKPFEDLRKLLWPMNSDGWASWKQHATALVSLVSAPRFRRLARAHGVVTPEHFWGVAATGRLNVSSILAMIEAMPEGTSELMCHPGKYDAELEGSPTRLKRERETELEALTAPEVSEALEANRIQRISFRELS
ncbi:MAG TPA: ChbG/HpnK family deacetylase [Candidatus Acidoferrales bacterium]|nr:ChbG/HpnK family deacetylase [Candidatus Acidoferrales bacterium]